jgi:hypothetical protein
MKTLTNPNRWMLAAMLGLCSVQMAHAEETVTGKLVQGLFSKAKSLATGEATGTGNPVSASGERSLRSGLEVLRHDNDFTDFLAGYAQPDAESATYPTIRPSLSVYHRVNQFPRLQYEDHNGIESSMGLADYLERGYGYQNSAQMFCHTLTATLVEVKGGTSKLTNREIINGILSRYSTVVTRGQPQFAKVKYIEEFGGDLPVATKRTYLTQLLQKPLEELEGIRFLTKKEGDTFNADCYQAVGGDPNIDPLEFTTPDEDYLLKQVPEFRRYIADVRTREATEKAAEAARKARDRKIELERQAEAQEAAIAQQKALELRRAKDAAEAERLQQSIAQKQQEQSTLVQKQDNREKSAQDQADAEARRKAALEALGQ